MARNGSGIYQPPSNSWNPAVNGTPATASDWQNLLNDISSALTQSFSRDGQSPMEANLPMGNNKITGLAAATTNGDAVRYEQAAVLNRENSFTAVQNFSAGIAGVPIGTPNLLINPEGFINQRGYVSGTATTAANEYTLDRWRVAVSGQNLSWTDSGGLRTFTCPAGGVEQVIEGSNIRTGLHVLNWNGTATATINGVAVLKGATVNLTGGSNVTVRFSGGTMSLPRFEPGAVATPFWSRLGGTELGLCQRYRESGVTKIYVASAVAVATATNFRVQKRAVPTMFYASPPAGASSLPGTTEWVTTTSFAVNKGTQELAFSWVADAEIY